MRNERVPAPTERVRFRLYRESDVEAVVELFGDPQARAFYPDMDGEAAASRWIEWNLDNYQTLGFGLWVLEDPGSGRFLGDCGLTLQEVEGEQLLEVGYHVVQPERGRGLATEAGKASVAHAFDVIGADLVCSIVSPRNEPSMAVAGRLHKHRRSFVNRRGRTRWLYWSPRSDSVGI